MSYNLYEGDCLEVIPTLTEDSVDLIILDPPYNIGKDSWDKFPSHEAYLDFIKKVLNECERVLKDNGSLYFWHNQFESVVDIFNLFRNDTDMVFKQLIVWNKRFNGASNKGFLDGFVVPDGLRNYQKMAEYLLYYTFQDETGLTTIKLDLNNFTSLRQYFKDFQKALGVTKKTIIEEIGQCADHCFRWKSSQWDLPTFETYQELCKLPLKDYEFIRKDYESLRTEYEDLRREYESLRYTYNNQKTHHSIWEYEIENTTNHQTQKPIPLCENIIKHSSNPNDTILIPFAGSGSEMIASTNLNRNVIGIEKSPEYCNIIRERLNQGIQTTITEKALI
jgi:site-specific DNA-methyltransferase (adenine-specific)